MPKNDYFGHKCAFWAKKRTFFGFNNTFETIKDFPGPKLLNLDVFSAHIYVYDKFFQLFLVL